MRKRLPIAAVAAALAATTAVPAFAGTNDQPAGYSQPVGTPVSTLQAAPGTRQLEVLDVAGAPLAELKLVPNVAQSFRVAVVDTDLNDLATPFSVTAVMNNLYQSDGNGGYTTSNQISSKDVSLSFPASPISALGVGFQANPDLTVAGTIPSCNSLLSSGILNAVTVLTSGLCNVVDPVTQVLTQGVLNQALTVPNVDALSTVISTITNRVALDALPFDLTGDKGGPFTDADYANGIGHAVDPQTGTTPTMYTLLQGTPDVSNLTGKLGYPTNLPLVSPTGSGALTSLGNLLDGLTNSGNTTLQQLSTALQSLGSATTEVAILNNLAGTLNTTLQNLSAESGTYNAFPSLKVTPSNTNQAAGTYSGTMTITMVQQ